MIDGADAALAQELAQLHAEASTSIPAAATSEHLEQLRVRFLGRKSRLHEIMKALPRLPR